MAAATAAGPVGKPRKVLVIFLLSIITLGIYGLVWVYKTFEEMKRYSGKGVGGLAGLLLYFIYVSIFLMPSEVGKLYNADGKANPVSGYTGFWIFVPLVGGLIWLCKTQWALNSFWEAKGATA